jgi:hypothetical protein
LSHHHDNDSHHDRTNCKPSPALGATFTAIVFQQVTIAGTILGDFLIFIRRKIIGDNNWIDDDCIVDDLTELVALEKKMIALTANLVLLTKPLVKMIVCSNEFKSELPHYASNNTVVGVLLLYSHLCSSCKRLQDIEQAFDDLVTTSGHDVNCMRMLANERGQIQ